VEELEDVVRPANSTGLLDDVKLTEFPSCDPDLQSSAAEAELVKSEGRFAGVIVSVVFARSSV
jgi:hypothetical protein